MTRDKNINTILFFVMVLLTFLAVFYVYDAGKEQDAVWSADYDTYVTAQQYYIEGELTEARELYGSLLEKPAYQSSATINLYMAAISRQMKEYGQALEHFNKARKAYPAVVNETLYLQEYALTMYETENDQEALKYLQRTVDISKDKDARRRAQQLIEQINLEIKEAKKDYK